jgi:hypothetical protein
LNNESPGITKRRNDAVVRDQNPLSGIAADLCNQLVDG